jgi:hypothetical protein
MLSTLKNNYLKYLFHEKLYYVNTKQYLLFYEHIISRVATIINILCSQFEGENKLN